MASADYTLVTPERVSLEYAIAGIGSRGGAVLVDTLVQLVVLAVVSAALAGVSLALPSSILPDGVPEGFGLLVLGLWVVASFAITTGYFMVFEIVWNGQTPGKRLLGLRVIRHNGYPIRPVDAVIRNLVRVVDWLPFAYGVGALVMLMNARSRRLGDFAGGTLVVREGRPRALSDLKPVASVADESGGLALSGADATLVRDFLVRREGMDPRIRADLALRLATALAHRYRLPHAPSTDAELFLERLAG